MLSPLMKGADVVNILIIGGLFALGIVALLVVVVLARGEQRQYSAKGTAEQAPSSVEAPPTGVPEVPAASPSQRLTVPLDGRNTLVERDEQAASVQLIPVPQTGFQQFHEMADELHALHQHAWELEQRLGRLSDMVEQLERGQNGQTSVEEEPSLSPAP